MLLRKGENRYESWQSMAAAIGNPRNPKAIDGRSCTQTFTGIIALE
jgi:hypothetical protein